MSGSTRSKLALGAALLLAGALQGVPCLTAVAAAAPITVELRVEGSTSTLYEGPVTTEGTNFETRSSPAPHPCDYAENGSYESEFANGGPVSGTPTTALRTAALASGLAFDAEWFGNEKDGGTPGDFLVTQVGPDANLSVAPFDAWGFAVNYTTAPVGGCQIALVPGSEVLWAYNYFNLSHLLLLSGPGAASAGTPFTVHVADAQSGSPLAEATIGEDVGGATTPIAGAVTNAAGNATVTLVHAGAVVLKAERARDSVRSNGVAVCVHNGSDGTCGTTLATGVPSVPGGGPSGSLTTTQTAGALDRPSIQGIANGHLYSRRRAPRLLRGSVAFVTGATLREVRIRLERRVGRRCYAFRGERAAFVRAHCGTARFFSIGTAASFTYLLPAPLPAGSYTYDIDAVDARGHVTPLVDGVSHVAFRVR